LPRCSLLLQALLRAKDAEVSAAKSEAASASVTNANSSGSSQLQGEVAQLKQLMEAAAEAAHQQLQQQQQSYDQQVGGWCISSCSVQWLVCLKQGVTLVCAPAAAAAAELRPAGGSVVHRLVCLDAGWDACARRCQLQQQQQQQSVKRHQYASTVRRAYS
jgi:hypothetical protein